MVTLDGEREYHFMLFLTRFDSLAQSTHHEEKGEHGERNQTNGEQRDVGENASKLDPQRSGYE